MLCKLILVDHGNHDNIHFIIKYGGTQKKPLIYFKLVGFFSTETAYILHSSLKEDLGKIIDYSKILTIMQEAMNKKLDFTIKIFSNDDFYNRRLTSKSILNKL